METQSIGRGLLRQPQIVILARFAVLGPRRSPLIIPVRQLNQADRDHLCWRERVAFARLVRFVAPLKATKVILPQSHPQT